MTIKHPLGVDRGPDKIDRAKIEQQMQIAVAWPVEHDPELTDARYSYQMKVGDLWFGIRLFLDARAAAGDATKAAWFVSVSLLDHRWQPRPIASLDKGHLITMERIAKAQIEHVGDASHQMNMVGGETFNVCRRVTKTEAEELAATLERINS